jgi:chitinase
MVYDVWGPWSATVGPNAPLDDSCASSKAGSAASAVQAWTTAHFPADKIILGVASYGHSFCVTGSAGLDSSGQITVYPPFDASKQPLGDKWDDSAGVDTCGNPTPAGGIFQFWGLVQAGFLNENGTAAAGISYRYDECSQTVSL